MASCVLLRVRGIFLPDGFPGDAYRPALWGVAVALYKVIHVTASPILTTAEDSRRKQ